MSAAVLHAAPSSVNRRIPSAASSPIGASRSPRPPERDGPGHGHLARATAAELEHLAGHRRRVDGGLGVGHGDHRREPAEGGRPAAPLATVSASSPARLAQVGVQVDQPGRDEAAAGVEHRARPPGTVESDSPSHDHPPSMATSARRGAARSPSTTRPPRITTVGAPLSHGAVRQVRRAASAPSSRKSTAMRTATPLVTCRVTTELGQVGHLGGDLDAADHRPGVGHDGVRRARPADPVARSARTAPCTRAATGRTSRCPARPAGAAARRRRRGRARRRDRSATRHRPPLEAGREQAARARHRHLGPERGVGEHFGAGHPAVADVAHDQDPQPLEAGDAERRRVDPGPLGEHLADGEAVDERLGRVLVPAVTGVDAPGPARPSGPPASGRPTRRGADDQASMPMASTVSTVSRSDSPFLTDGGGDGQREHVGRQPLGRRLEARAGSASTPRRTRWRRPCPAASGPWGWPAARPRRRPRPPAAPRRCPPTPRSAIERRCGPTAPRSARSERRRRARSASAHRSTRVPMATPSSLTSTISSRRVGRFLPT